MAEEVVKILTVQTEGSVKSVKGLRDEIKSLRDALLNMEEGTAEYDETVKKLQDDQEALTKVMSLGKREVEAAEGSYNALVKEMAALRKEWRATSDEAERDSLGKQILSINNKLKDLDASTGNFQRNVGNYKGAIVDAFASAGGAVGKFGTAIKNVTPAAKALSATPLIAVLGALATILTTIIGYLKTSEENMNDLATSTSNLSAIGDVFTNVMQYLGKAIVAVVGAIDWLIDRLGIVKKGAEERLEIARQEIALNERLREQTVENAKSELQVSELRAKAADKANYSLQERVAFLQEAIEIEQKMADAELKTAEMEFQLAQQRAKLTGNSKETNDQLAQAEANLYKVRKEYYDKTRRLTTQLSKFQQDEAREQAAAAKEREEATRREQDEAEKQRQAEIDAQIYTLNYQNQIDELRLKTLRKGSDEALKLRQQMSERTAQIDRLKADKTIQDAEQLADQLTLIDAKKYERDMADRKQHNADISAEKVRGLQQDNELLSLQLETVKRGSTEEFAIRQMMLDNQRTIEEERARQTIEDEQELANELLIIRTRYGLDVAALEQDQAQAAYDRRHLELENEINSLEENSMERLKKEEELALYELENLHQMEWESDEEFRARQKEAEKKYNEAHKKTLSQRAQNVMSYVNAVANLMSAMADIFSNENDEDEKAKKRAKNMQIASTVISTLSGAAGAYMQAVSSMPPVIGPIVGAANAATALATGYAQIKKMNQQDISKDSKAAVSAGGISANVTPVPVAETPIYRSLTTATEEDRLNRAAGDQRVYLVYSDVEAAGRTVRVQNNEASF